MFTRKFLCGGLALGLAACTATGDAIPIDVGGRIYLVSGNDGAPLADRAAIVTAQGGASLTQADQAGADQAFAVFCETQGREPAKGRFMQSASGRGYWYYEACAL